MIEVYVDGACSGNNLPEYRRKAGIGVFFGDNDPRNISEMLPEHLRPYTNNRAEIYACIRALDVLYEETDIVIYSDSKLVVNTMTGKYKIGKNKDLWNILMDRVRGKNIVWKYVPGHSGIYGNEMSDMLAVQSIS